MSASDRMAPRGAPWRPSREPERYYADATVHQLLTDDDAAYVDWLLAALARIGSGAWRCELPPKWVFDEGAGGDFRVMPCVIQAGERTLCKAVKVVGTNLSRHVVTDQITVGQAMLLHLEDNFVAHRFAACVLSSARTGGCAAAAAKRMAPDTASLQLVGCGRVGYYAVRYCAAVLPLREVVLHDSDPGRAEQLAGWLTGALRREVSVTAAAHLDPGAAELLVLATDSQAPLLAADRVPDLTISLGADARGQRELPDDWPLPPHTVLDTRDSLRFGDLAAWQAAGRLAGTRLVELASLCADTQPVDTPALFVSTGSALLDALTMLYLTGTPGD